MEKTKTFRRERAYLIYAIILFFVLINLFFLPKATSLTDVQDITTPLETPSQIIPPVTNNNPDNAPPVQGEKVPITPFPETKKVESKQEQSNESKAVNKVPPVDKKEDKKENNNAQQNKNKNQENTNSEQQNYSGEKSTPVNPATPKEEEKVPIPKRPEENKKPQTETKNDDTNSNNQPIPVKGNEDNTSTSLPEWKNEPESKPEGNKQESTQNNNNENSKKESKPVIEEPTPREQMTIQQNASRRFFRGFENFCMFGFIGVIAYLIYNNGDNQNNDHPSSNNDNKKSDNKQDNNSNGYALLDDDNAEYYENI